MSEILACSAEEHNATCIDYDTETFEGNQLHDSIDRVIMYKYKPATVQTDETGMFNVETQTDAVGNVSKPVVKRDKRNVGIQCRVQSGRRSHGTQTETSHVMTRSIGIQCKKIYRKCVARQENEDGELEAEENEVEAENDDKNDPTYVPSGDEDCDEKFEYSSVRRKNTTTNTSDECMTEQKYIVYESMLLSLFAVCMVCRNVTTGVVKFIIGSMVGIEQHCTSCNFYRLWRSQPYVGSFPAGNIHMSSAILFSGSSIRKVLRMFASFNIAHISSRTFSRHQKSFLFPAIKSVWSEQQDFLLDKLRSLPGTVLGGDGRADSPGHSAKFGSYAMVDLHTNTVVDLQLVQSNEVGSSYHMELEGLKQSMEFFVSNKVNIARLVTDRHAQVSLFSCI